MVHGHDNRHAFEVFYVHIMVHVSKFNYLKTTACNSGALKSTDCHDF